MKHTHSYLLAKVRSMSIFVFDVVCRTDFLQKNQQCTFERTSPSDEIIIHEKSHCAIAKKLYSTSLRIIIYVILVLLCVSPLKYNCTDASFIYFFDYSRKLSLGDKSLVFLSEFVILYNRACIFW